MSRPGAETLPMNGEENTRTGQSTLHDFDMEFSRMPAWIESEHPGLEDMDVFVKEGPLNGPDYDLIQFLVVEDNSYSYNRSRQEIESFLLENGDRDAFDEIASALEEPSSTELWEEIRDGRIPLKAEFEHGGSWFRVDRAWSMEEDGEYYPVGQYFDRRVRPGFGEQVSTFPLRRNLGREDKEAFEEVVSTLKNAGATLYVTGSILETRDYNDIDIAVDGSSKNADTPNNRGRDYPFQAGSYGEHQGLPENLHFTIRQLENALKDLTGASMQEIEASGLGDEKLVKHHEYEVLEKLYSFTLDGTEFHIGYDQEPFSPAGDNPRGLGEETRFAKI